MSDDLFSVKNKKILITGGTSGIGRMMVEGLAQRGARVYTCSRKPESVQRLIDELGSKGLDVAGSGCSVAETSDVDALVARVSEHFGGALDVLVNNAGATWGAPLEQYPMDGWDKVFDLNVRGLFYVSQRCVDMLAKGAEASGDPSRIIHVGSIAGFIQPPDHAYAYHASKAAVAHLGRNMAKTLAARSINVNTLAPGVFPSKMTTHMFPGGDGSMIAADIPAKRVGKPDDIVGAIVYLASRASSYVTGSVLAVGGGVQL